MKKASAHKERTKQSGLLVHASLIHGAAIGLVLVGIGMAVVTWSSIRGHSSEKLLEEATALFERGNHIEAMVQISRGLESGGSAQTNRDFASLRRKVILQKKLVVIQRMITEGEHEAAKVQLVSLLKESPEDGKGRLLMRIVENALARKQEGREAARSERQSD